MAGKKKVDKSGAKVANLNRSNESKQTEKAGKNDKGKEKSAGKKSENAREAIQARIEEDGDVIEMEVEGQRTEFMSEEESKGEDGEVSVNIERSQSAQKRKRSQSTNNNANKIAEMEGVIEEGVNERKSQETGRSIEEINREEEAFFERFHRYMERKGIFRSSPTEDKN